MLDIPHKTLIIRFSSVGDIILSSLLVRIWRHGVPHGQIDFLVKSEYAGLVASNPFISRVIEFPAAGTFRDLRHLRDEIRQTDYDLIIDIHDSLRSCFLCLGARHVVRIKKRKIARFLLVHGKFDLYPFFHGAPGVAERYLEAVRQFGIKDDNQGLEVFIPDQALQKATSLIANSGFPAGSGAIGLCPSAKHNNKMWLRDRFAESAALLAAERNSGVIIFGSSDEDALCREVEAEIRRTRPETLVLNAAGNLTLIESAALMDRCELLLTNDTGLMHLATARKRPVVAIFGPTVRQLGFFPTGTRSVVVEDSGLDCRPCTHVGLPDCPLGHFKCMKNIPVSRVVEAARQLLQ